MNASGSGAMQIVQIAFLLGVLLSPFYIGGCVFAGVVLAKAKDRGTRVLAVWTLVAQFALAAALLLAVPLGILEIALDQGIEQLSWIGTIAAAVGPAMSLLLIAQLVKTRVGRATPSAMVLLASVALVACSPNVEAPETAIEKTAAQAPVSDAVAETPAVLTAVDLRRVCRAGLAAIHGQKLDAIQITGAEGEVLNAQWRAPVDGGWMKAQCRAGDGLVVWKPLELPDPAQVRWMNEAGDPVVRYTIRGEEIEIVQALPDGTTQQAMMAVRPEEEVS